MPGIVGEDTGTSVVSEVSNTTSGSEGEGSSTLDVGKALDSISSDLFGSKGDDAGDAGTGADGKAAAPASAAAAPAVSDPKAAVPAPAAGTPDPAANPMAVAPKTWKPEEAAVWATIPEAAKAAIVRREEDIFRGIEQYRAPAAFGQSVMSVLEPYKAQLLQNNIDPVAEIRDLLQAHHMLSSGTPVQKSQMLAHLVKEYGLDPASLTPDPYAPPADPRVEALEQELNQLRSGQTRLEQDRLQAAQQRVMAEVESFANDPANVHFNDPTVGAEVARLLKLDKDLTLPQAYERAVWSNPVTRAKEIARQDAEKQTKAREEAAARLAEAQRAKGVNVRTQPKAGAATMPLGSMDDTLAETLGAIKSRG